MTYLYLFMAIVAEVIATSSLKAADGFTKLGPSLLVVIGYFAAFFLLSLVLRSMTVGIAYAIWSGVGIVLLALVGAVAFREIPDTPAVIGMGLIIAGVIVIHAFSQTVRV
ncbi:MAG: multidrug efflux SMR transporter [Nitrospiraceae bacterium]|nr:multidrug efflux SMR transporter [Nitrospira sp.]MCA9457411.1 multidrug efflux SMR transporter [Nitrospira sp.]MCB9773724.1 multidrug efflux SMR transporter [Nitrospiraceae bacterium]MCW5784725.1 multidrug efflux SMR transporter [Nitrospirales bacterium]